MFIDCSNMLNEMRGALPVSAEDAPGLQAAARELKDRPYAERTPVPDMEVSYARLLPANGVHP